MRRAQRFIGVAAWAALVAVVAFIAGFLACLFLGDVAHAQQQLPPLVAHVIVDSCSGCGGGAGGDVTIVDGSNPTQKASVNASGQLSITCANCSGSGASAVDGSTFTQGTNSVAPIGGLFKTSYTALTSGQVGIWQMTASGAGYVNLAALAGTAVDVNSGNKSAGTLRVVLATDQPALTNALKVDGSAVTQPVSGTFWQATQPVSGTFWQATQPVSIATMPSTPVTGTFWQATQPVSSTQLPAALAANGGLKIEGVASGVAVPVSGTFWQATQPVSAASLPLPSGAATAAKQPALGTAGSASADVLTVQGTASMTALKVDGSGVTQPVSGTVTANAGTNLNTSALALEAGGNLATIATNTGRIPSAPSTDRTTAAAPFATRLTDGTAFYKATTPSDTQPISAASLPLPSGAATSANQATEITSLGSIDTKTPALVSGRVPVDGSGVTQPVTVGNFPTAASTSAVAIRCVDITGSTFEACGGASSGGNVNVSSVAGATLTANYGAVPTVSSNTDPLLLAIKSLQQSVQALALRTRPALGGAVPVFLANGWDPCMFAGKGNVAVSQTASTRVVVGQAGKRIAICAEQFVTGTGEILNYIEGTGTTCGTATLAVAGSTAAANGMSYGAQGGISAGMGLGTIHATTLPGNDLCLSQSGANRVAGGFTYVYF